MIRVAFVLLTHRHPAQIHRLVRALNAMYECPRIVIHHDFHQCPLDGFPDYANVRFVEPARCTKWADFSVVSATVDALRMLLEPGEKFDWFAVVSGADYPVKSGQDARRELAELDCDACMHHEEIHPAAVREEWHSHCVDLYYGFDVPRPRSTPHGFQIERHRVSAPWLLQLLSPYSRRCRCFAGSQWFSARAHVAGRIISSHESNRWLARHLRRRPCPEETYFQTLVCNDKALRIRNDNLRYIDFSGDGSHPKHLGVEDITAALSSGAHFARKFDPARGCRDRLDKLLGIPPMEACGAVR